MSNMEIMGLILLSSFAGILFSGVGLLGVTNRGRGILSEDQDEDQDPTTGGSNNKRRSKRKRRKNKSYVKRSFRKKRFLKKN